MDSDDIWPPTFFSLPPKSRFIFHTSDLGQRARSSFLAADRCRLFSFFRAIPAGREREREGRCRVVIASLFFSPFLSFLAFALAFDNALSMQARDVVYLLFVFLSFFLSFCLPGWSSKTDLLRIHLKHLAACEPVRLSARLFFIALLVIADHELK